MTGAPQDPADAEACPVAPTLWLRLEADGTYRVGLTTTAARRAGAIVHYRGPVAGRAYAAREPAASLESEKWVEHLALPLPGTVVEVNPLPTADPGLLNRDPEGAGWLCRVLAGPTDGRAAPPSVPTGAPE